MNAAFSDIDVAIQTLKRSFASSNPRTLKRACRRYRHIFAVYPQYLDQLPEPVRQILLSVELEEIPALAAATTPAELAFFGDHQ